MGMQTAWCTFTACPTEYAHVFQYKTLQFDGNYRPFVFFFFFILREISRIFVKFA